MAVSSHRVKTGKLFGILLGLQEKLPQHSTTDPALQAFSAICGQFSAIEPVAAPTKKSLTHEFCS